MPNENHEGLVYRTLDILIKDSIPKEYQEETQKWAMDLFIYNYSLNKNSNKKINTIYSLNETICSLLNYSHKLKIKNYQEFDWDFHPKEGNCSY